MESSLIRQRARENLAGNWGLSVGVTLLAVILGGVLVGSSSFEIELDAEVIQQLPESVVRFLAVWASIAGALAFVQFIVGGTVQLGYTQYLLKQHDRQDFTLQDLFSQFHRFGQGFAQAFLRNLYVALWSLLLIIPGIVKNFSYAMTPFIMADHPEMTASEAITASKEMMDGHKGELFWLGLTFFGWSLLCALTLGIGNLFLNPYMNAAYAAFYRQLSAQKQSIELT